MRNLVVDIIFSLLFLLVLALGVFRILSLTLTAIFLFALLFVALIDFAKTDLSEEPSKKYLENARRKELREIRMHIAGVLTRRIDGMIEKVKYLKLLLRGEVLVLE